MLSPKISVGKNWAHMYERRCQIIAEWRHISSDGLKIYLLAI